MINLEKTLLSAQLDFRGAPADELIAATSIAHRLHLLRRNKGIRQSKLVSVASWLASVLTADNSQIAPRRLHWRMIRVREKLSWADSRPEVET